MNRKIQLIVSKGTENFGQIGGCLLDGAVILTFFVELSSDGIH